MSAPPVERLTLHVSGVVQGVGFRPYVHRLAARHALAGWVRNASGDVEIEVEGPPPALDRFLSSLEAEAPPLAKIDRIDVARGAPEGRTSFEIVPSLATRGTRQPVSPDVALCSACEADLFDVGNRRHRYPFVTCTDCGPRFTVIEAMPYDRERTSMRAFRQCTACLAEYHDPADRRYHSETNSCPNCGPTLWFHRTGLPTRSFSSAEAIHQAAAMLARGGIVAIRGLGGFHLAVDATRARPVERLRQRKHREAKPLAVMVRTLAEAEHIAALTRAEKEYLSGAERPIVVVEPRPGSPITPAVHPGLAHVGLMLAYTPLHHLLLAAAGRPLVMTSGNLSEEPIATGNTEARERLGGIADGFLLHDREIISRYDDSVLRLVEEHPVFLRRARGYAPLPVPLPVSSPVPLIAVGPHLKNTLTLVHGDRAYVSQHVGDLENLETLDHFHRTRERLQQLFHINPEIAVRDLHPGYLSTRVAEELGLSRLIPVQHHHAHIAAVMAEHGVTDAVLGVAFDGTGWGEDGTVWGAEFLLADLTGYRRLGHLRSAPLPGGDRAARAPWRAALGYASLEPDAESAFELAFRTVDPVERTLATRQLDRRLNTPVASSMGRLFDAAAAVLGVRAVSTYEGQAAMELESIAGSRCATGLPFPIVESPDQGWILDPLPLLVALGERRQRGGDPRELAAEFHESVAAASVKLAAKAAVWAGVGTVALGGGSFQNRRLLRSMMERLEAGGLRVLVPTRLSPNDGAISYGQAAIAAALLSREHRLDERETLCA